MVLCGSPIVHITRLHITIFLAVAVVVWGGVLVIIDAPVGKEHTAPFGAVVTALTLFALAFEHVLWRLGALHGWFVSRPDLRGTWRVEVRSDWSIPSGQNVFVAYMGITQTLSKLQLHLMTAESDSWSFLEGIRQSPSGRGYQVSAMYSNKPRIDLRADRSEMHQGALLLDTHGPPRRPLFMTGEYWTDRKTSGQLRLTDRSTTIATHFDEAHSLFVNGVVNNDQRPTA
jgi:hypothetical protein